MACIVGRSVGGVSASITTVFLPGAEGSSFINLSFFLFLFLSPMHRVAAGRFVVDVRGATSFSDVCGMFSKTKALLTGEEPLQRVVFLADKNPAAASRPAAAAVEGMCRSLAKEVGIKGCNVNTLYVPTASPVAPDTPMVDTFLDPARFKFVTGQSLFMSDEVHNQAPSDLTGQTIVVTGATGGIGASIVQECVARGADVVAVDHPASGGVEGANIRFVGADLGDDSETALNKVIHEIGHAGQVHGVVHCAGVTLDSTLKKMPEASWETSLKVNLFTPMRITEKLGKEGAFAEGASLVAISSVIGICGNRGQTHYAAGKRALREWVRVLSEDGIRSYAIAPGFILTPMVKAMPQDILSHLALQSATQRLGEPEDIADVTATLLSPSGAAFEAGQTVRVCGGFFWG